MSEVKEGPQGEFYEETFSQISSVLEIARQKIYTAASNHRGRLNLPQIAAILSPNFNGVNDTCEFVLDRQLDYSLERHESLVGLDISLARFPHFRVHSSIVSEGIRIKIAKDTPDKGFVEYHTMEKDKDGNFVRSPQISNKRQRVKATAFANSI